MDVIKTQQISAKPIKKVIVHPLVLLSIVDNCNRVAKDTRKRVVGVLLGSSFKGSVCYQQLRRSLEYPSRPTDVEEMLNKEHEKAEDSKPATAPATSGR
ncbi:hypothetical protein Q3G72_014021 [Acer saccharum]|nr:hypothetical protein Q3G72_014021 [Acer saccharum]